VKRYADPYLTGVSLGLVLLAAYAIAGRGLGASGAFSSVVAAGMAVVEGPEHVAAAPATSPYVTHGLASPFHDWLVIELLGVVIGGFASAWFAGRRASVIERGHMISGSQRVIAALAGGVLMGVGAKFARGCTSGQALTGGALLAAGSWIFIVACFATGYALAPLAKRLWR
jgi:uncharacterized protein